MKRFFCWLCVLVCMLPAAAGAQGQLLEGLELLDCVQDAAGYTYLTGRPWGPGQHGGRLICLDPQGALAWQTEPEEILYSIAPLADGQLLALRRNEGGSELWLLRQGRVVSTHTLDVQCLRLHPAAGGVLLECAAQQTLLVLLDENGKYQWQCALPETLTLTGVAVMPDGLYCAGYLYRQSSAWAEAVLWRISPDGQRCETVDRITNARFTALAPCGAGVLAAMDTEPEAGPAACRLMLYSPEGQVWRSEYSEESLYALLPAREGFLAAARRSRQQGQLGLLTCAPDGALLGQETCPAEGLGIVTACHLLPTANGPLAVVCGRDPVHITLYHTLLLPLPR